jgi:hypothetical protein
MERPPSSARPSDTQRPEQPNGQADRSPNVSHDLSPTRTRTPFHPSNPFAPSQTDGHWDTCNKKAINERCPRSRPQSKPRPSLSAKKVPWRRPRAVWSSSTRVGKSGKSIAQSRKAVRVRNRTRDRTNSQRQDQPGTIMARAAQCTSGPSTDRLRPPSTSIPVASRRHGLTVPVPSFSEIRLNVDLASPRPGITTSRHAPKGLTQHRRWI